MAAVELLRDRILDHFEASGGQPLPMSLLRDTARGLRPHDSEPGQPSSLKATVRLWGELPDTARWRDVVGCLGYMLIQLRCRKAIGSFENMQHI